MAKEVIPIQRVVESVRWIRGQKVLIDSDLATLYGVPTKQLNRAVKRNVGRFPSDFMFQLTVRDLAILRCRIGTSRWGGRRVRPYAFTEQGIAMLSSVLNSERAVKVNIAIMRAFVKLRQILETNRELAKKFSQLERHFDKHDKEIAAIIDAIRQLMTPPEKPRREIGFHARDTSPHYRTRKRR